MEGMSLLIKVLNSIHVRKRFQKTKYIRLSISLGCETTDFLKSKSLTRRNPQDGVLSPACRALSDRDGERNDLGSLMTLFEGCF